MLSDSGVDLATDSNNRDLLRVFQTCSDARTGLAGYRRIFCPKSDIRTLTRVHIQVSRVEQRAHCELPYSPHNHCSGKTQQ